MTTRTPSTPSPELQARRDLRALRQQLRDLTETVTLFLARLDAVMQGPSTESLGPEALGRQIAALANARALHFGLGLSFPAMARQKQAAKRLSSAADEV